MPKISILLRKYSILVHRWMGVAFCVIFFVWFVSGIVMMYWDFPRWTPAKHLARSERLNAAAIQVAPKHAYDVLNLSGSPDRVRIDMLEGRPVYRFHFGNRLASAYADDGQPVPQISSDTALRIASAWLGYSPAEATFHGLIEDKNVDQWTVHPSVRPFAPFLKYSWPNGEDIYVSQPSGEVVQHTTRGDRIWAYLGAIPHWTYFTVVRRDPEVWRQVVTWASGIGTVMSIFGIVVGVWLYSPSRKRYRFKGGHSSIPYAGQKRWHTMLGLIFGLVTCTWAFSGMMSMSPFAWFATKKQPNIVDGIRGTEWRAEAFSSDLPGPALARLDLPLSVKEVDLAFVGGKPVYIATEMPQHSIIIPVAGNPVSTFDVDFLAHVIAEAARPHKVGETRLVTQYESYYVDRGFRSGYPLPALFVRLDDAERSMYYVDLRTARVVQSYSSGTRWNRWLYHGLHSFDIPWLYRYRPLWDIVVLSLMLGGTALCVTSCVIGWRRLRRKLAVRGVRDATVDRLKAPAR
jgi:hypothetical protein